MNTMKVRISLEEARKISKLTDEEIEQIRNFNEDFSDPECPEFTDEELAQFRPAREIHPEGKLTETKLVRMSSEDLKKIEITDEEIEQIRNFNEDFSDPECPPSTDEELAQFRPAREVHPEWFKPRKKTITIRLDIDVIEKYKSMGKGYQTKMNAVLRKAAGLD